MMMLLSTMAFSAKAQVQVQSPHPDLSIKVTRCAMANDIVIIDMVMTNFGKDVKTDIRVNNISAYDDEGNSYTMKSAKIKWGLISEGINNGNFTLPREIPLKFRLQIEGVDSNASKFVLLKFPIFDSSNNAMGIGKSNPIQIRNLEWVK